MRSATGSSNATETPRSSRCLTGRGWLLCLAFLFAAIVRCVGQKFDTLEMGNPASETSHSLVAQFPAVVETTKRTSPPPTNPGAGSPSDIVQGGKGLAARRLLPRIPSADMYGGELRFTMKVDPVNQNYFTLNSPWCKC